jgi:photosystem II stability/assembly factor-like uncharacterized protein
MAAIRVLRVFAPCIRGFQHKRLPTGMPSPTHAHSFDRLGFPQITDYVVKCVDSALADHSCAANSGTIITTTVPASALPLQGNLTNVPSGVAYVCYAIANNGVAGEQCSAASNVVQARRSPSVPTVVNATSPASGRIDVSFTPSSDLGAPPIARYIVACLPYAGTTPACAATGDGVQSTSVPVGATPQASVFGLADGAKYVCYAIASNGVGGNACSAASAVTTVATWRLAAGEELSNRFSTAPIWRSTDSGASWTEAYAPDKLWRSIASSSDGSKLAAVTFGDRIWRSTDSGASWTEAYAPKANWYSIASSSDGSKLAAVINGDRIWRSTDSGASWTEAYAPKANWYSITSSSDGSKLAAVIYKGRLWRSTDSGASWTETSAPQRDWVSIASSSDGSKLAAVTFGDRIWRSTDSGASWTEAYAPKANWYSIASSSDGSKLAAVINGDRIWRSTDSGASWTEAHAPQADWYSITSSSDGSKLAAVIKNDRIWRSTDSGASWTEAHAPQAQWTSIASSA